MTMIVKVTMTPRNLEILYSHHYNVEGLTRQTSVTPSIGRKKSQPIQLLPPSMTTISSPTTTHIVQQPTQTSAPSVTIITLPTTKIQTRQQQSQPVHVPPSVTISNSSSTTKHTHGNIHRKRQSYFYMHINHQYT